MIKKLELHLMIVSILSKIKFGHAQINVPKISIPMSKTACINPCVTHNLYHKNVQCIASLNLKDFLIVLKFVVYFTQMKTLMFSLKKKKKKATANGCKLN